jgi:hypothetical protein
MMVTQGDKNKDQKLSKAEFSALADSWFGKMDSEKKGKLSKEEFSAKLAEVLNLSPNPGQTARGPAGTGGGQGGAGMPAGPTGNIGPGLFGAADANKDGTLTGVELKVAFQRWFTEWDAEKSGQLNEEGVYAGLKALLPQQGGGGFGGGGRGPGGGGPGGGGPAPKPLTAEQVGLVRAWIDQGAK